MMTLVMSMKVITQENIKAHKSFIIKTELLFLFIKDDACNKCQCIKNIYYVSLHHDILKKRH